MVSSLPGQRPATGERPVPTALGTHRGHHLRHSIAQGQRQFFPFPLPVAGLGQGGPSHQHQIALFEQLESSTLGKAKQLGGHQGEDVGPVGDELFHCKGPRRHIAPPFKEGAEETHQAGHVVQGQGLSPMQLAQPKVFPKSPGGIPQIPPIVNDSLGPPLGTRWSRAPSGNPPNPRRGKVLGRKRPSSNQSLGRGRKFATPAAGLGRPGGHRAATTPPRSPGTTGPTGWQKKETGRCSRNPTRLPARGRNSTWRPAINCKKSREFKQSSPRNNSHSPQSGAEAKKVARQNRVLIGLPPSPPVAWPLLPGESNPPWRSGGFPPYPGPNSRRGLVRGQWRYFRDRDRPDAIDSGFPRKS